MKLTDDGVTVNTVSVTDVNAATVTFITSTITCSFNLHLEFGSTKIKKLCSFYFNADNA